MFNSMNSHIAVITLLMFTTMNEAKLTKLETIENLLSEARGELPGLTHLIITRDAEIEHLKDKIILETGGKSNSTIEKYISCWREYYGTYYRYMLFERVKNGLVHIPGDYGPFIVEHSLRQYYKEEANAHEAQWRSVSATVDCEHYKPSGNEKDLQQLKHAIENSFRSKMLYSQNDLLMEIYETAIKKLKPKLTKLETIENLLSEARGELPGLTHLIITRDAEIEHLKDKIILETGGKSNSTIEKYISCWREYYGTYYRYMLFERVKNGLVHIPGDYGPFIVEHSLRQYYKEEAKAHEAQWRSVSATVDCEHYKPSGNEKDLQQLKHAIENSFRSKM
ncbi:unnamed protein product, partial [Trichobilharzia szidati]